MTTTEPTTDEKSPEKVFRGKLRDPAPKWQARWEEDGLYNADIDQNSSFFM